MLIDRGWALAQRLSPWRMRTVQRLRDLGDFVRWVVRGEMLPEAPEPRGRSGEAGGLRWLTRSDPLEDLPARDADPGPGLFAWLFRPEPVPDHRETDGGERP